MISGPRQWAVAFTLGSAVLAGGAGAADEPEPLQARLEIVDMASRQVQADGVTYALSSTVSVQRPGLTGHYGLGDLDAGMNVVLDLVEPGAELPVVKRIVILAE
ncbi:MAG: hypothetical protein ABIX37_05815 [Gammaproteobacteria bacterium]